MDSWKLPWIPGMLSVGVGVAPRFADALCCVIFGPGAYCYQETSGDTATNVRGLRL